MDSDRLFTSAEAATYLRFETTLGIRMAVKRGDLKPFGVGPRQMLLFKRPELDRFVQQRLLKHNPKLAKEVGMVATGLTPQQTSRPRKCPSQSIDDRKRTCVVLAAGVLT